MRYATFAYETRYAPLLSDAERAELVGA